MYEKLPNTTLIHIIKSWGSMSIKLRIFLLQPELLFALCKLITSDLCGICKASERSHDFKEYTRK